MAKNRARLIRIATVLLAISFFVQVLTVIGMVFFEDLALRIGVFSTLVRAHTYNGFIFVALVLAHLYFNWGWARANMLKRRSG